MIELFKVHMPKSVDDELLKVLHSGFIGQGEKVLEFENKLSKYFGNPKVLTLNSGTSGLHLALRLSNVMPGDEVICTPMTCTASNMPVLAMGATIVWADIDPVTGLIDINSIKERITNKTKAIIMVHFGGLPCQIDEINQLAKKHGLKTIEDAAHAFGSEYKGQKIGVHSDFVMFSLQAIKHITTIDGGLLLCKSDEDYKRGKLLRWYGIDREEKRADFRCENNIAEYGYKFHMNDIAATIGIEQLNYIDWIVKRHISNANYYDIQLNKLNKIKIIKNPKDTKSSRWLYTIHVENRDEFIAFMKEKGIATSRVHERNDIHDAFKKSLYAESLPNVDSFNKTQVSIPVGWWLEEKQLKSIVEAIKIFDERS